MDDREFVTGDRMTNGRYIGYVMDNPEFPDHVRVQWSNGYCSWSFPPGELPSNFRPAWQTCKDCSGSGAEWERYPTLQAVNDCSTCEGTGRINRTGPYRLASGSWSDGVDRTHRVNSREFGELNPNRYRVVCQSKSSGWYPLSVPFLGAGMAAVDRMSSAEAIAYADAEARTNRGETK